MGDAGMRGGVVWCGVVWCGVGSWGWRGEGGGGRGVEGEGEGWRERGGGRGVEGEGWRERAGWPRLLLLLCGSTHRREHELAHLVDEPGDAWIFGTAHDDAFGVVGVDVSRHLQQHRLEEVLSHLEIVERAVGH